MKRFSDEELKVIRNQIPVRYLIQRVLKIPSKEIEGVFRFLYPICGEFQTGVHEKTNLCRFFRCRRNFNTIELTMEERKQSFVDTVKSLRSHYAASLR